MLIENLRIIVDERERKSRIADLLKKVGAEVEIKTLPIGDYIVAPETIIERKTIHDLISSVFDGRLYDQCMRLKEHFEKPILLLEGDIDELETIVDNPFIFYGAISTVTINLKIPIIPTPNAEHTAKLLLAMCKSSKSREGPFLKKIKKSSDLYLQQLAVISSLPGIGEKFAVRLLDRFGTPDKVFAAKVAELAKIDGLGSARAKKIRHVLDTKRLSKSDNQKTLDST